MLHKESEPLLHASFILRATLMEIAYERWCSHGSAVLLLALDRLSIYAFRLE